MNHTHRYAALLTGFAALLCTQAHAADVKNFAVYKYQSYQQTDAVTVSRTEADKYVFVTAITPTSPTSISSVSVTLPNGIVIPNSRFAAAGSAIDLATSFPPQSGGTEIQTVSEFNTAYPSGSYTVNMIGATDGARSPSLNLTDNAYPNTPLVSNFTSAQSVNPASPFTLHWDSMSRGSATDAIWVEIRSFDGQSPTTVVWRTPFPGEAGALNGLATSAIIPANTLQSGTTYLASIFFGNVTTLNTSSYPGALGYAGYGMRTHFDLQTTGGATAPNFTSQPQSRTINEGESVTFTASASGSAPIGYQWKKDGASLPGRTTSVLTISSATLADSGTYTVVASNSAAQTTSSSAVLTVMPVAPLITAQPVAQSVSLGATATFSVTANGMAPLNYQWRKDGIPLPGGTGVFLTVPNVSETDLGTYSVTVSNAVGSVSSDHALLSLAEGARRGGNLIGWGAHRMFPFAAINRTFSAIATGWGHNLALTTDGQVVAWGRNDLGQADVPSGLSNVTAIAAAARHSVALIENGTIVVWGDNRDDQTSVPEGLTNVVGISASSGLTLALKNDGMVVAIGRSSDHRIQVPSDLTGVKAVAANRMVCVAVKDDGTVAVWGKRTGFPQNAPPPSVTNVIAISCGEYHSVALREDGTVVAWGGTGLSPNTGLNVPSGLNSATAVSAGEYDSLALLSNGSVVGWGNNEFGQSTIPIGATNIVAISAAIDRNLALTEDGRILLWGNGGTASLSRGTGPFLDISVGYDHILAIRENGSLAAWGRNDEGQSTAPDGLSPVRAIAAGALNSVAVRDDRTVVAWGNNSRGQCDVPIVATNVSKLSSGQYHNLALTESGIVVAWGDNEYGQTGVPAGLGPAVAIAAGHYHNLALRADGTVVAWGDDRFGQSSVPSALTNLVSVSAGEKHSIALRNDGTVVAWGDNSFGQTQVPSDLDKVVKISAGRNHSMALRSNGNLALWGANSSGELDAPHALAHVTQISAGWNQSWVLNAPPPSLVANENQQPDGFQFSVSAVAGRQVVVEYSDRVSPQSWISMTTNVIANGSLTIFDSQALRSNSRFYRAVER